MASWDRFIIAEPQIDSFKVLNTGKVLVPIGGVLNLKKMPSNHQFEKQIWVDVFAFLFHHKGKGWYLIDTGLDSTFQRKGNIHGPVAKKYIKKTFQNSGQNIKAQLKREGKKIEAIFFTHLHGDHAAGLPELSKAIPKYVNQKEKHINIPLLYFSNHLSKSDTLYTLDFDHGVKISPLESVLDIFGDGSFLGIDTPGHSSGHISYLLFTSDGPLLLTGDVSHTKYGFEHSIEPGWVDNRAEAVKSLNQLIQLSKIFSEIQVIYGHEMDH